MYLKTPKRYQKGGQRRRISRRTLVLAILAGLGILLAKFVLDHQEQLRTEVDRVVVAVATQVATANVPTPTPAADPMLCLSRANMAYDAGNLITAIDYYRCAAEGMPNNIDLHSQLAFLLTVNGRPQEGLEAAERAILADPTAPDGYAIAGMAYDWVASETGQEALYGEALAHVMRALDIDPNYADAHAYLSEIYTDMGRIEEAYGAAEKALELAPDNFKAHRNYGYALQMQGYFEDAAAAFEEAIRINPQMPYINIQLAQMYFSMGRIDDAMDLLLQAVQRTGGDPTSYYWLGHGYLVYMGDFPKARRAWETCVDVDPSYHSCWERLGNLLLYEQDHALAATAYDHAIEHGGSSPVLYYNAALTNQLLGRCDRAINYALTGLELPDLELQEEDDLRSVLNECRGGADLPPPEEAATPTPEPDDF